jgi:hypothetical protein
MEVVVLSMFKLNLGKMFRLPGWVLNWLTAGTVVGCTEAATKVGRS